MRDLVCRCLRNSAHVALPQRAISYHDKLYDQIPTLQSSVVFTTNAVPQKLSYHSQYERGMIRGEEFDPRFLVGLNVVH